MQTVNIFLVRIFLCPDFLFPALSSPQGLSNPCRVLFRDENVWCSPCPSVGSSRWVTYVFTDSFGALASLQQVGGSVSLPPSEALHKQPQP